MLPVAGEYLNFAPWTNRMGTMLRKSYADSNEEKLLDVGPLEDDDITDGSVEKHLEFLQRRRLCMLYIVEGAGGMIELNPHEDSGYQRVLLQPGRDRLLIFRHDKMRYMYESEGSTDLIMQSWIVDPPSQLQLTKLDGEAEDDTPLDIRGPAAPPGPGNLTWITSVFARFAGNGYGGTAEIFPLFETNVDGYICIPNGRFDLDFYYDADGGFGKTRTKHSALVADEELQLFDPDFFQWTDEEAQEASPILRLVMDGGFEVMYRAGLSRDELFGQRVGFYLGHTCDFESSKGYSAPHRLAYFLGLTGRVSIMDTACSSALVSICSLHQDIALDRACAGAAAGVGVMLDVRPYIAMSSGRMISSRGRSHTFDHSADGYGRGEGVACVFLEDGRQKGAQSPLRQKAQMKEPFELCRFASSAMNQDGRSASITAPSGPAQTACIKASLKECGLTPDNIIFGECHGTGTALGDPIEVGSSRMVNDPYTRENPLMLGAAKTQVGHLELGAGAVGAMRTILMLVYNTIPPNCHFGQLNEHFSLDGFPVSMPIEACPNPSIAIFAGVNSFGFGGTNSRAELWGKKRDVHADAGEPQALLPKLDKLNYITTPCPRCLGPMCWLCGVAIPKSAGFRGKHHCSAIRDEFARYEYCSNCYDGGYTHSGPEYADVANPGNLKVFIQGSWTNWNGMQEMRETEDEGVYEGVIRLGDTRCEQFRVLLDTDTNLSMYPCVAKAGKEARILGPDNEFKGLYWQINGDDDDMPEGTVYRVLFKWLSDGEGWKSISWEPTEELMPNLEVHGGFSHTYSVVGSWTGWKISSMAKHPLDPSLWEVQVRIGRKGEEEFRFVRDGDTDQAIYPMEARASATSIPAMGPDAAAEGRAWLLTGPVGSTVSLRLRVADGKVSVTAATPDGEKTWESSRMQHYLVGSWLGDEVGLMEMDRPGVWKFGCVVGPECREQFQIVVDQDPAKRIYPVFPDAPPGTALHSGPDAGGEELFWEVSGRPGQEFEIIFNTSAEDRRKTVTCVPVGGDDGPAPLGFAQLTN